MADTQRTEAALAILLADNAVGAISPQDVRDVLISSMNTGGNQQNASIDAAGSGQGDAAVVSIGTTLVTSSNGTKGVKLPGIAKNGAVVTILNFEAAVLFVYPPTDESINQEVQNAPISVLATSFGVTFAYQLAPETWFTSNIT